jgi:hypothetical protein
MSKDNNIPLCYQITVTNVTKIGDKVMSVSILSYRISMLSSNLHKKIRTVGNHQSFMADSVRKILVFLGLSS